jgi:hypothetical protein
MGLEPTTTGITIQSHNPTRKRPAACFVGILIPSFSLNLKGFSVIDPTKFGEPKRHDGRFS